MMPELIEISRDALRSDLETRVQALLNEAFPEGSSTDGDYYARHGVPGRILIAREAQQVVGHLAVYQRQVKMGDEVLEIGMIGAVAVAPDRRRRAIAGFSCGARMTTCGQGRSPSRSCSPLNLLCTCRAATGRCRMRRTSSTPMGAWKTLVYRGSMFAELAERRWPNRMLELAGGVV
jgi:hypothetical protein